MRSFVDWCDSVRCSCVVSWLGGSVWNYVVCLRVCFRVRGGKLRSGFGFVRFTLRIVGLG